MIEFEIKGVTYRAEKLDAFAQLHVSRKIAPIVPLVLPVLGMLQARGLDGIGQDMGAVSEILAPLANAFAAMPKDDADMVVVACLSVVLRKDGSTYSRVYRDGRMMFQDIELDVMLPLIVHVIRDSLGNFTKGLLSNSTGTEPAAAG